MKKFLIVLALFLGFVLVGCDPTEDTVLPTLDFAQDSIDVEAGDEFTLTPIIGETEENLEVEFLIEHTTIVSFDGTKFTALAAGSTKITASLKDFPAVSYEITVTVTEEEEPEPEEYTISYNLNGGTNPSGAVLVYTEEDLPVTLPIPTKEGYIFMGWYIDAGFSGDPIPMIPDGITGNQTFYAKWEEEIVEYTITYHLDGGQNPTSAPSIFTIDDLPLTLPTPTKEGYTFLGWFDNAEFSGEAETEIASETESNQEFYAKWEQDIIEYTITYHLNDGQNPNGTLVVFSEDNLPYTLPTPTKEGFDFVGWFTDAEFSGTAVTEIISGTDSNQEFYAKWEKQISLLNVYVSPTLSEAESGSTVSYGGREYVVGTNAFSTIAAAVAVAENRIYIAAGTYQENFTINKNNIQLIGPNNGVDPRTQERVAEAVLKGTITLANGVENTKIVGLSFTEAAKVNGRYTVKNFDFSFNYIHDTAAATSTWTELSSEVNAFLSLYNISTAVASASRNVSITNNLFLNVPEYVVSMARIENVLIQNNQFKNFTRDALRFDGGFNGGDYIINKNEFINDSLGGYNGIFIRMYGADSGGVLNRQHFEITHNTFKNIGTTATTLYVNAISARNYQEYGAEFNILYNRFEAVNNYIFLRNNATATNHSNYTWTANINHNAFIGDPINHYTRTKNDLDSETTNPSLINFDANYFEDNYGDIITDLSEVSSKINDTASYINPYQSLEEYNLFLSELETGSISMMVNEEWVTKTSGENFDYEGRSLVFGETAFSTIKDAVLNSAEGERIFVLPGTYSDNFTVSNNDITILSNNMNINPNKATRSQEAIITGVVTLGENLEGFVMNGLAFTGTGQIVSSGDTFDLALMYLNFFESTVPSGDNGLVYLKALDATDSQTHYRLLFLNNQFHSSVSSRLVNMDNVEDMVVRGNHFETSGSTYADALRVERLTSTVPVLIESNTFTKIYQYSIFIRNHAVTQMDIINNTFTDLGDYDGAISVRTYFGEATVEDKVVFNVLYNTFETVSHKAMRIDHAGTTETSVFEINVHYNIFKDGMPTHYFFNNLTGAVVNMNQNYFSEGKEPQASKFVGVVSNTNHYENMVDVPKFEVSDEIMPTHINILNEIATLVQFGTHQLEFSIGPELASNKKITFISSDESIATVNNMGLITALKTGTVTITLQSQADPNVVAVFFLDVVQEPYISASYTGNGALDIGEEDILSLTIHNLETTETITYTSSNTAVATVDQNGRVVAVSEGNAIITAELNSSDVSVEIGFTVYDSENTHELLQLLIDNSQGQLFTQNVAYIGFQGIYTNRIYSTANFYLFAQKDAVVRNMIPSTNPNYVTTKLDSLEYITIHDTGSSTASSTAQANSNWATNPTNSESSWHYTIGNDGVYQQVEDDTIAWHAGDGTTWGTLQYQDTGVTIQGPNPVVTINPQGYYVIGGVASSIQAPLINGSIPTTNQIHNSGIITILGENGNYWMGQTYVINGKIANRGGNRNSIGIETAINDGSDVYWTWQKTAKHVADLLVKHDLTTDRVKFHQHFSGKLCPQTMITAGLDGDFLQMVEVEHMVRSQFNDYTITMTSHNPEIMNNRGQIINAPAINTNITYTIHITNGTVTESITLNAFVPGQYDWK